MTVVPSLERMREGILGRLSAARKLVQHSRTSAAVQSALRRVPRWITANRVTAFRAMLSIAVAYLVVMRDYGAALFLTVICAFLDWVDGALAHAQDDATIEGAFFDPFADKLMVWGVLLPFAVDNALPAPFWFLVVPGPIIAFVLTVVRVPQLWSDDPQGVSASTAGKLKLVAEMTAVIMLLLWRMQTFPSRTVLFAATVAIAAIGIVAVRRATPADARTACGMAAAAMAITTTAMAGQPYLHCSAFAFLAVASVLSVLSLRDQIASALRHLRSR